MLAARRKWPPAGLTGDEIGGLLRLEAGWAESANLAVALGYERLDPGSVLERAGMPAGDFAYASFTMRY